MLPGNEFRVSCNPGSFCVNLKSDYLDLPVTYLNPTSVNSLSFGYTLTHSDLVVATRCYKKLDSVTNGFSKNRIRSWTELSLAMDFILVGSTTDTPNHIINRVLYKFISTDITTIQLDILRTFLIKNPSIGIAYSSSRFTQYLLNMGKRRNHNHSYLCKTISGDRAAPDSEDWDMESAEEDILQIGKSDEHNMDDFESDDEYEQPRHFVANVDTITGSNSVVSKGKGKSSQDQGANDWSNYEEEVSANIEARTENDLLDTQTAQEYNLWSDTESEPDIAPELQPDSSLAIEFDTTISNVTTTSPIEKPPSPHSPDKSAFDINTMFSGINFDDVFDPQADGDNQDANALTHNDKVEDLNSIFERAITGSYEVVKDIKDKGLKSVRTGHTVSPNLETARSMISFLKEWIEVAGSSVDVAQQTMLSKNISSITGMYSLMDSMGILDQVNPLETSYGQDNMVLPISLSALAVIAEVYG